MPAKKTMKKTAKKTAAKKTAPKSTSVKAVEAKKCDCGEKCSCRDCDCSCGRSQLSFYLLIGILVATLVVLVISVSFNRSVRDIFRPATYIYNGKFDSEVDNAKKGEGDFTLLSAGAVIDMVESGKEGFLIIGNEKDITSDAFARRVSSYVEGEDGIYYYQISAGENTDDVRAENILGLGENDTPTMLYIKNGVVYDRIDDVKDTADLSVFLNKYLPTEED